MTEPKYRRSSDAIFSPVGDDVVALHIPKGRCYGMEDVSSAVWNLLDVPIGVDGICERLVEVYEVDPEQCRAEVSGLIEQMQAEGLVEPIEAEPNAR